MELSATELRIGNYHFYHIVDKLDERGEYDEICKIDADDFRILENFDCPEYKPIPLTEEWFLKFGFENSEKIAVHNRFVWYKDHIGIKGMLGVVKPVECKYVHQLQNLYFAMTGEELKRKL